MSLHHCWAAAALCSAALAVSSMANAALVSTLDGDTDHHFSWMANTDSGTHNTNTMRDTRSGDGMGWRATGGWVGPMHATSGHAHTLRLDDDTDSSDGENHGLGEHSWAGQSCHIAQAPLPAAAWLFVSGLAGLLLIRRRSGS